MTALPTKKKTRPRAPSREKPKTAPRIGPSTKKETVNLDDWTQGFKANQSSVRFSAGRHTCGNTKAVAAVRQILEAMARTRARQITLKQIHRKVQEMVPDYHVGFWGFKTHLYDHEIDLYNAARGKGGQ